MPRSLDSLVSLNKTQTDLLAAQTRLGGIPDWMKELHEEHSQRQAEIDEVVTARDTAAQQRRAAEGELSELQEKVKRYQEQLRQVSSEREYTALLKEIDTVKAQINASEQQILELIEKHDQAEKDHGELQEKFRDLDERYKTELTKWESEKPEVARTVEELTGRVEEIRETLPHQYRTLFDRLYQRYTGQAVTRVVRLETRSANAMWHCEACSYAVRPQIVIEIRNDGTVIQCDACKRFLYLDE